MIIEFAREEKKNRDYRQRTERELALLCDEVAWLTEDLPGESARRKRFAEVLKDLTHDNRLLTIPHREPARSGPQLDTIVNKISWPGSQILDDFFKSLTKTLFSVSNADNIPFGPQPPCYPISPVKTTIGQNDGWRLDLLEKGQYLVLHGGAGVAIFHDKVEAIIYYIAQSHVEKACFGSVVAKAATQPILYRTLVMLTSTLEEELEDLFDKGAYWRANNRPQKQIDAAWNVTRVFISAVRSNRRALTAEGLCDPAAAAKQVFLATEARIKELADGGYLEKSHLVACVMAAQTQLDHTDEPA